MVSDVASAEASRASGAAAELSSIDFTPQQLRSRWGLQLGGWRRLVLGIAYFNPSVYSRSYSPPAGPQSGDIEAFAGLAARLAATGEFGTVMLGFPDELRNFNSERLPAAVIRPQAWTEEADARSGTVIRHVTYSLQLAVRCCDAAERYCILAKLGAVAQNALDRDDLGGRVISSISRLSKGRFELASSALIGLVTLTGEFGYFVEDVTARVP
jgi:hypothetical protein